MRYRVLGKTKLRLSVLGFGGAALGGSFGAVDVAEASRAVRAALDGGINFFDVAPVYGETKAESELGKALAGVQRGGYFLSTKVGRHGLREFDYSSARVIQSVEDSLRRLKTDYLDIIQCHDIEFGDLDQVVNETVPALHALKKSGKVRFVGITGYPLKIFWYVLDRMDVDTVQSYCHYTLNDTSLTELFGYLADKKVGLINAAPTGMGLMTGPELPAWHPAPAELREACRRAFEACAKRNYSLAELAVKFAADRSEICTTLVGMTSAKHVEANIAAIEKVPPVGLMKEVEGILAAVKGKVWVSGREENN